MKDKFLFNHKLKDRIKNDPFNHISSTSLYSKLVLSQHQKDPIFYAIQNSLPAACLILVYHEEPGQETQHWTGSGFLLQQGVVVTSNHILPDEKGQSIIKVSFDGETKFPAQVNSRNDQLDIGTLSIGDIGIQPIVPAAEEPIPGEQIAVIVFFIMFGLVAIFFIKAMSK